MTDEHRNPPMPAIRISLDKAGIPDRRVGTCVRVAEALGELELLRAYVAELEQEATA